VTQEALVGVDYRQDFVVLGSERTPGRAIIKGASAPRTWDKRKGYGTSGATLVYTGADLAKFSVEIDLWDPPGTGHWLDWEDFARKVLTKEPTGKSPKALVILHPILNAPPLSIISVVIEDVTQWVQDDSGLWTCEIKLCEFRAPKPAVGSPKSTGIPTAKKAQTTAKDAADQEIERLLGQFQKELAK